MTDPSDTLRYKGNLCIAGLTAAGKTTHSHLLAGEFGLTYVSASQILLNFMGVSPIQNRDFWITPAAKAFWKEDQNDRLDEELSRIEGMREGCIFDTWAMPWRRRRPALSIWLESTLESRVLKSIVSHHGENEFGLGEYAERIADKDRVISSLYRNRYGFEIGVDFTCFDLVIDISSLIAEASLDAALESIRIAHSIIGPAAAYYLTGRRRFRDRLQTAAERHKDLIRKNTIL